jgi:hypothetical protein
LRINVSHLTSVSTTPNWREHYAELEREHYAELEREHLEEMKAQAKPSPDNAKDGGSSLRDSTNPVVEWGAE